MKLTILTCTGDRPEAFELCEQWMARQTRQPDQWLVLDDGEKPARCTMGQQHVRCPQFRGKRSLNDKIAFALRSGLIEGDALAFIEDDDWYAPGWLAFCVEKLRGYALIGEGKAIYYNVAGRWWIAHENRAHASLCATAITRALFPVLLAACKADHPFIDTVLWTEGKASSRVFDPSPAYLTLGMKSLPGRKGYGNGHLQEEPRKKFDRNLVKLRELIGDDAECYRHLWQPSELLPSLQVHILAFNEAEILPFTLRHYLTMAETIIVHDGGSTDGTADIAHRMGAVVQAWDTDGKLNDQIARELKAECWKGTKADWVIVVDADELIWSPMGLAIFDEYDALNIAIAKPHGWEMFSDTFPTGTRQIYDEIKHGARDDKWYGKPVAFSPKRVREIKFTAGAHSCLYKRRETNARWLEPITPTMPPLHLLHFHQVGPIERIAARYDATRRRLSSINEKNRWGNFDPGLKHAQDKRASIVPRLEQVIP